MEDERELSAEEAVKIFVECAKQQFLDHKYKLPSFKCPKCGTGNILFADTAVLNDRCLKEKIDKDGYADYVIACPKCRGYIAVRRCRGFEKSSSTFYSAKKYIFMFHTVYNNRIRGIYHCVPPDDEPVFEGRYECSYTYRPINGAGSYDVKENADRTCEREERLGRVFYEIIIPKGGASLDMKIRSYTSKAV